MEQNWPLRGDSQVASPELGIVTGIAYAGMDLNWIYAATEDGKLFRRPASAGVAASGGCEALNPPL